MHPWSDRCILSSRGASRVRIAYHVHNQFACPTLIAAFLALRHTCPRQLNVVVFLDHQAYCLHWRPLNVCILSSCRSLWHEKWISMSLRSPRSSMRAQSLLLNRDNASIQQHGHRLQPSTKTIKPCRPSCTCHLPIISVPTIKPSEGRFHGLGHVSLGTIDHGATLFKLPSSRQRHKTILLFFSTVVPNSRIVHLDDS